MKSFLSTLVLIMSFNAQAIFTPAAGAVVPGECIWETSMQGTPHCAKRWALSLFSTTTTLPTVLVLDDVEVGGDEYIAQIMIESEEEERPMTQLLADSIGIDVNDLSERINSLIDNEDDLTLENILSE